MWSELHPKNIFSQITGLRTFALDLLTGEEHHTMAVLMLPAPTKHKTKPSFHLKAMQVIWSYKSLCLLNNITNENYSDRVQSEKQWD